MRKNTKPTQCDRIIRYLKEYGTITSAQAMQELGVYRLASRISELKKDGWEIEKRMVRTINRWGEAVHFAEYSILQIDEAAI